MFNSHELRLMALSAQKRALDRIPVEEEQEMQRRVEGRQERGRTELAFLLKSALSEGVPVTKIREALGAKNWKTWARMKTEYLIGSQIDVGNRADRERG